jgi:DNA-binding CsgD family transcriptional regulator
MNHHPYKLTAREIEIVKYVMQGLLSKQIAIKLQISKRTVDAHRKNILQKCGAQNFAEVVATNITVFSN